MKLNVAHPHTGKQKKFLIEDEHKLVQFTGKSISSTIDVSFLGGEWKGYVLKITGGSDKQGFPLKQGVLTKDRVRLLLSKGHTCFKPRRTGERKRRSVRGCQVDHQQMSLLNAVIVRKGENDIPGLTDQNVERPCHPKRASKIRKVFNLTSKDDVRKYAIGRKLPEKGKRKACEKKPKIQRLITPITLQRKRRRMADKRRRAQKNKEQAAEYHRMLQKRLKEAKDARDARKRTLSKSRSSETRASASK